MDRVIWRGGGRNDVRETDVLCDKTQKTIARDCAALNGQGVRPSLCEGSGHMRLYYLRCLCESLLSERLRGAAASGERAGKLNLIFLLFFYCVVTEAR